MAQASGSNPTFGEGSTITTGTAAPTGIYAVKGSIYVRTDTGASTASTRLYINGTGDSTWVAITTAS